jgi:hypothetical protein
MTTSLTPSMLLEGYTIERAGHYELESSAAIMGRGGVVIAASGVALDLRGRALSGSSITDNIIRVSANVSDVQVYDGAIEGGLQGLYVQSGCANVSLRNLYISSYRFAALVIKPSRDVSIHSCLVGRAHSAPKGSIFGIVALPQGGFPAAERIISGASVRRSATAGGDGLVFARVTIEDITPLRSSRTGARSGREQLQGVPCITDIGFPLNSSSSAAPPMSLGLTHDLKRRVQVLGSIPRDAPEPADVSAVTDAGAHGLVLINWLNVRGLSSETRLSLPSPLFACSFKGSGWGSRSALLELRAQGEPVPVDEEDLSQIPLGVAIVRVRQSATPPGAFVPGAAGVFIAL